MKFRLTGQENKKMNSLLRASGKSALSLID